LPDALGPDVTTAKAQRLLLDRLASGSTMLLSEHLATGPQPWTDGVDADGRAVLLVGRHLLGDSAEAQAASALATVAAGAGVEEALLDGERNTGKTQVTAGTLAALAELHARAGYPLPLIVLWLHSSLVNAKAKTVPSLVSSSRIGAGSGHSATTGPRRC
jgi:hypothetical protein